MSLQHFRGGVLSHSPLLALLYHTAIPLGTRTLQLCFTTFHIMTHVGKDVIQLAYWNQWPDPRWPLRNYGNLCPPLPLLNVVPLEASEAPSVLACLLRSSGLENCFAWLNKILFFYVHIQSLLIHHLTSIWGTAILCKDTAVDAGDATVSFLSYPVGTSEIDSRQTVLGSRHISSLYL